MIMTLHEKTSFCFHVVCAKGSHAPPHRGSAQCPLTPGGLLKSPYVSDKQPASVREAMCDSGHYSPLLIK